MNKNLKEKIISLRAKGHSYNDIRNMLHCSKGTISFHCQNLEDNKNISKNNKYKLVKYRVDQLFDEDIRHKITILYQYGIFPTEISDVLKLNINEVIAFCKSIPRTDYSHLSNYDKVKRRRKKLKVLGIIYKGSKCQKCGYDKYFEVLDFHHIDPSKKDFSISDNRFSWKKLKKELDKCVILCSVCHRELHVEITKTDLTPKDLKLTHLELN